MIITFMSDFGTEDGYVGSVKGVLYSRAPQSTVVDITHAIPPFDVKRAAYTLLNYYDNFPAGTIHLAVVDPGVGSERKPIILQTRRYFFVGPDNGLFSLVQKREAHRIWQIVPQRVNTQIENATFHGRDLFAPAAAMLANGFSPSTIAQEIENDDVSRQPFCSFEGNVCKASILAIDHFGNIATALHRDDLKRWKKSVKLVTFKSFKTKALRRYYAEVNPGEPLALWNSLNFLEIAVREGNAGQYFNADVQKDQVIVELEDT